MKWGYKILPITDVSPTGDAIRLAEAGDDGWEAVAVWGDTHFALVLLKRQKEEKDGKP